MPLLACAHLFAARQAMPTIVAILVGLLIGAATGYQFGLVAGPLLGWLLVRGMRQQREIEALRHEIATRTGLQETVADLRSTAPVPVSAPAPAGATGDAARVEAAIAAAMIRQGVAPEATVAVAPPPATTIPASPRAAKAAPAVAFTPAAPPRPPRPNPLAPLRDWFFGGNTIVKAGIAILFIGLAFLAKYAAEHSNVPIEWRLAGIGAVGVALLAVGWRLRTRRAGYAQVLQGGAVAVLYLTIFAAFRFYGVLAVAPAFAMMAGVAAFSAALAVLQDARPLAVVGALGGFAAPLLLSTGSGDQVALFSYYLVLDLGIAAIAWLKAWRSLNLIGFVFTFVVATAWGVLRYRAEDFASSEAFLIAFFLVFVVVLVLPARHAARAPIDAAGPGPRSGDAWVNSSLLFGLPTVTFALQYGLVRDSAYGAALSALGLAAFYVGLATWMRRRPALGITFDASLAIAVVFLTLVIPFALDERSTAGAWTLEAAGLVWIGFRQQRLRPRAFGYALFVISALTMLYAHDRYGPADSVFNAYLWNGVMAGAAAIAAALFVHRAARRLEPTERAASGQSPLGNEVIAQPLLIGLGTLWFAATAIGQIDVFVLAAWQPAAALATLAVATAAYAALARRFTWPGIAWPILATMPVAALVALAQMAGPDTSILAYGGWWAWPLVFAAHALALAWVAPTWPRGAAHAMHAMGAVMLAFVGALVGRALTGDTTAVGDPGSAWPWLGWLVVPALLLLVLPRPRTAQVWPVRALPEAYAVSATAAIALCLWGWTLVANAFSDGSAAPLPHLPLVNPLDIGIGVALMAIVLALRGPLGAALGNARVAAWAALSAAGFVWLNAILLRGFFHYGQVPYDLDAWADSFAVQTGLALLWTATALATMWIGARRGECTPWLVGAALLAAVVVKLVFVDLGGAGTVTRIVSFIGVGLGMLVIGYVAPIPSSTSSSSLSSEDRHVPG